MWEIARTGNSYGERRTMNVLVEDYRIEPREKYDEHKSR